MPSLNHTLAGWLEGSFFSSPGLKRPLKKPVAWDDQANTGIFLFRYQEKAPSSLAVVQSGLHMGSFQRARAKFGLLAAKPAMPFDAA